LSRIRGLDELDALRSRCIAEAVALPPEAVGFRPSSDGWSVAQVLHHLCRVEEFLVEILQRPPSPGSSRPTPRERLGALIVKGIFTFGLKVRMPTQRVAPDPDPPLQDTVRRWEKAGRKVRAGLEGLADPRQTVMRHPVAGPLDAEGTAAFLVDHVKHHVRQLDRIRRTPGFPAGPLETPS
jgi:hypothetical protein